jgi:hypothetical protein
VNAVVCVFSTSGNKTTKNESTPVRIDDDVVVLYGFDGRYRGLLSPRMLRYARTVSSKESLIYWKIKPTSLCFIATATFQELPRGNIGGT